MMNQITIGQAEVSAITYRDQRVVTFAIIDEVHGRAKGTAKRNFNENRSRFVEGEDFAIVPARERHAFRTLGVTIPNRGLTVLTRRGYLKLVKSQNDDLAWAVFDDMIDRYFAVTGDEIRRQLEMPLQHEMLADLSGRTETALARLQEVTANEVGSVRGYIKTGVVAALGTMARYLEDRFKALHARDIRLIHDVERLDQRQETFGREQRHVLDLAKVAVSPDTIIGNDWVTARGIFALINAPHSRALSAKIVRSVGAYAIEADRQMDVRSPPYDRTQRLYRAALVRAWYRDRGRRLVEAHLGKSSNVVSLSSPRLV